MTQAQVSSPAMAVQSLVNSGMTSVVSSLGGGGVTNTITNSANNQLVQQVITANINITGLVADDPAERGFDGVEPRRRRQLAVSLRRARCRTDQRAGTTGREQHVDTDLGSGPMTCAG